MMRRHVALVLGTGLLFTAACSPEAQPPDAAPADAPKYGGTLNTRIQVDPSNWDITAPTGVSYPNQYGPGFAFNSLLGVKAGSEVEFMDQVIQPELAERWEVSPDARVFTFHLRRDVKFADLPPVNGREVTSADVKWSFEYLTRTGEFTTIPRGTLDYFFQGMEEIRTPDPLTVSIQFKDPYAPFLGYAADKNAPVLPREIFAADGHFQDRIVGTGPYQLDQAASQKGARWVWKKNPSYWEQGVPYLDQVNWLVIQSESSTDAAFRAQQIDIVGDIQNVINPTRANQIRSGMPNATLFPFLLPRPQFLVTNNRTGPLSDPRVRKAITRAIDRDEFIKVQEGGAWGLMGGLAGLFPTEEIRAMLPHDPTEAKRLLADAGYPDGFDLDFTYPAEDGDAPPQVLLQAQLKKVGINLVLRGIDRQAVSANRRTGNFVINLLSGGSDIGDPANWLFASYHPKSRQNYWGTNDPNLTDLLDKQLQEPNTAKRTDLIKQAVRYVNAEAVHGIAVTHRQGFYAWQPYVHAFQPNFWRAGAQMFPVERTWVTK